MASRRVELIIEARDARATARDVRGVAGAIDATGAAAGRAERKHRAADAAGRAFHNSLRSIATVSKIGIAGLAGIGIAGAKMGVNFNAGMEQQQVAFAGLLGSTAKAEKHLGRLYKLSANTPFEFQDVTQASRKLLAYGQSAKESNKWLGTIGDTVAGVGGGKEEIDRLVNAIGQIQAKGKASTEEMLQISELGIPAFDLLAKHTGRSMGQVFDDLADGSISSKVALKALGKGMDAQFGGAAAKQAKTFNGQVSTLKDNARLFVGEASKPLFEKLRTDVLPTMNRVMGAMSSGFKARGLAGMVAGLDEASGAGGQVNRTFGSVKRTLAGVDWGSLRSQAAGAFASMKTALADVDLQDDIVGPIKNAAGPLGTFLDLAQRAFALPGAKTALVTLVALGVSFKALNGATGGALGAGLQFGMVTAQMTTAVINLRTANISAAASTNAFSLANARAKVVSIATTTATKAQAAATWLLNLAMRANPMMLVITALMLLGAGFVLAYQKIGWFRSGVQSVWEWIKTNWPTILMILTGPVGIAVVQIVKHWDSIKSGASSAMNGVKGAFNSVVGFIASVPGKLASAGAGMFGWIKTAFKDAINFVIRGWNSLQFRIPGFDPPGPGPKFGGLSVGVPKIPELAKGGSVTGAGSWITGEAGPELNTSDGRGGVHVQPLAGGQGSGKVIDEERLAGLIGQEVSARISDLKAVIVDRDAAHAIRRPALRDALVRGTA